MQKRIKRNISKKKKDSLFKNKGSIIDKGTVYVIIILTLLIFGAFIMVGGTLPTKLPKANTNLVAINKIQLESAKSSLQLNWFSGATVTPFPTQPILPTNPLPADTPDQPTLVDCGAQITGTQETEMLWAYSLESSPASANQLALKAFYTNKYALLLGSGTISSMQQHPADHISSPNIGNTAAKDIDNFPLFPAVFLTDITNNPADTSGDAQTGGLANKPNDIYGTWKAADAQDPTPSNGQPPNLGTGADPWPPANGPGSNPHDPDFKSEIIWKLSNIKAKNNVSLIQGNKYRAQLVLHDGGNPRDIGLACFNFQVPYNGPTPTQTPTCSPAQTSSLRGVNWSGWEYGAAYGLSLQKLTDLKNNWNVNIIRFSFNRDEYMNNPSYAQHIRDAVNWSKSLGITSILDHQWESQSNTLPALPDKAGTVRLFSSMAQDPTYQNSPLVWFDLWNEPHNCTIAAWKDIADASATEIRKYANNTILVAGIDWAKDVASWHGNYLTQSNIIYSLHPYSYNANDPSIAYLDVQLGTILKDGQQVFIGEMGTCPNGNCYVSDSATISNIQNILFPWLDGTNRGSGIPTTPLGFTAWSMTDDPLLLNPRGDINSPTEFGQVIKDKLLQSTTSTCPTPTLPATDTLKYITVGDPQGKTTEVKTAITKIMNPSDVDFVVFLGDIIDSESTITSNITKPYYLIQGNHDKNDTKKDFLPHYVADVKGFQLVIPGFDWQSFNWSQVDTVKPGVVFTHCPTISTCGSDDTLHKCGLTMRSTQLDKLNMKAVYGGHTHTHKHVIESGRLYVNEDAFTSSDRGTCNDGAITDVGYTQINADGNVCYKQLSISTGWTGAPTFTSSDCTNGTP